MAKVEKWNGTTLRELMRGMKNQTHWPDGLVDKLMKAIDLRNYLAHHYLREYFVTKPSEQTGSWGHKSWLISRCFSRN